MAANTTGEQPKIAHENRETKGIDTDLFSRVIPIMGAGNIKKIMEMKVLVSGMTGLGAEIAKNLVLSGIGAVTIHDTENVQLSDLSANFYLTPEDVGKNRAEACKSKFAELNPYTTLTALTTPLTPESLEHLKQSDSSAGKNAVVLTNNRSLTLLQTLGDFAHANNIVFIVADSYGLFSHVFTDFGDKHTIFDATGEEPGTAIVTLISPSKPLSPEDIAKGAKYTTTVTTYDEKPHGFGTGDYVQFSEIRGMKELNYDANNPETAPLAAIKVTNVLGLYGFEIELDSSKFSPYISHGLVTGVKVEEEINCLSFKDSLLRPGEFIISDFAKFGRAEQFHFGYQALLTFSERNNGRRPEVNSEADVKTYIEIVNELNNNAKTAHEKQEKLREELSRMAGEGGAMSPDVGAAARAPAKKQNPIHKLDEVDEKLLQNIAVLAQGDLNPLAAFLGGVVAQEVLKVTGKFRPISQWFHFDSLECVAENVTDRKRTQTRYDGQIAVFGTQFQEKLANLKLFLVGAGALGCEFGKNFAMMGIATGENGIVHLTDMDNIEKSNLSRQFLFREKDIGAMKSKCAGAAVKIMNPDLKIKTSEVPVGTETEDTWTDDFWRDLDLIVNALDNVKARLYVDGKCVDFLKPLLESGTQGTKANTQVILPKQTESYGSSRDPPDTGIPMCTLKNFPHAIEHTIEWSRDRFQGYFNNSFEDVNLWLKGDELIKQVDQMPGVQSQRERLDSLQQILSMSEGLSFKTCVEWARLKFEDLYHNTIEQLLFNFPVDAKNANGTPFWSGPKRAPTSLKFDPENSTHLEFVIAAANILAYNYGVKDTTADPEKIKSILKQVHIPEWKPKSGVRIKANDNDATAEGADDDTDHISNVKTQLSKLSKTSFQPFHPAHFEKDDDTNFHIAFITAASNLRAMNYSIPIADFQKTKKIAGRIIPAIATTTAMITGLVCLELYKIVAGLELEKFRNSFVNLALPSFVQSEPMPCVSNKSDPKKGLKCYPEGWTLWDKFVVDEGDLTFKEFINVFETKHKLIPISISCGKALVYNPIMPGHKDRLGLKISEWVRTRVDSYQIKPGDKTIDLVMLVEDPEDELLNVEIPDPIKFKFTK
eukprot:TRINITY_DN440_c0_g1_i1.p1 TRINITY_DN440_c0_g1~~TRINITY_DN440_c0_g1_i1.p1  ORF type:complete len:1107 (-),score=320.39 TRINITY_DN440_c0_g1_i1:41-3361(-)